MNAVTRLTTLAGEKARENKLFSLALAAGAVLRLFAVLGYPGALWFAGDSYVYLGAALRPQPDLSKSTGYSLFLRALLPFHSLTLVVVLQHLMGLAVAVMIYVLLRRNGVARLWSTVASLPVLLDGYMIENEHLIMAESLFTFLLMVAMLLLLWRSETKWWVALIAGLLVGYAVDVRTEGAIVLVLFPLFLLIRGWRNLRGWVAAILMGVGCLLPVGAYASLVPREDRALRDEHGRRLLPVGPGVVVRGLLGDQAHGQRSRGLPDPAAVQADPARQLHLARPRKSTRA